MPDTAGTATNKKRPLWYNLNLLHLPVPALMSIGHRASGAFLFLGLIWFLFLLDMSLVSSAGFEHARSYIANPLVKLSLIVCLWAYLHHLFAGIRHLLLDLEIGLELSTARKSAVAVFAVSIALTALIGARLW